MATTIDLIAQELFEDEFDDHTDVTEVGIRMWLHNNMGKLNVLLFTDFQITDGVVAPTLKEEEKAILKEMFLERYYKKLARSALKGSLSASISEWVLLKEGDTTFGKVNKNELIKTLNRFSLDHSMELKRLVSYYNRYQAKPLQVNVTDA